MISLNPYSFLKSEQDGAFAKLIWSKCDFKVAEPYLILHRGRGQALIFQCYGFSVGGNHISYQQYTWNTQNTQWNTQNTQESATEMSQWSVMSGNPNQISIIAEFPMRDEDFVFKFNLVLDSSSHNLWQFSPYLLPIDYFLQPPLTSKKSPSARTSYERHQPRRNIV